MTTLSDAEVRDVLNTAHETIDPEEIQSIASELLILRDKYRRVCEGIPTHLRGTFFDDAARFDLFGEVVPEKPKRVRRRRAA